MLGRLIKQASNALALEMNEFAKKYDLTGTQMSIIDFLGRFKNFQCDQQQIEQEFAIKRSTTTVLLQRMAKRDLVTRQSAPDDHRRKVVQLTSKGQQLLPIVSSYIQSEELKMIDHLSTTERATVINFLNSIIKSCGNKSR